MKSDEDPTTFYWNSNNPMFIYDLAADVIFDDSCSCGFSSTTFEVR